MPRAKKTAELPKPGPELHLGLHDWLKGVLSGSTTKEVAERKWERGRNQVWVILTELPDSAPSYKALGGVSHTLKSRSWALVLPHPSATGDRQPWGEHEGSESLGIFQLFIWARWCPCPRAVCEGGRCQLSAAKHTCRSRVWKRMRGDLDGTPAVITTGASPR